MDDKACKRRIYLNSRGGSTASMPPLKHFHPSLWARTAASPIAGFRQSIRLCHARRLVTSNMAGKKIHARHGEWRGLAFASIGSAQNPRLKLKAAQ
jgi:hypothetical protein